MRERRPGALVKGPEENKRGVPKFRNAPFLFCAQRIPAS